MLGDGKDLSKYFKDKNGKLIQRQVIYDPIPPQEEWRSGPFVDEQPNQNYQDDCGTDYRCRIVDE
jgi:hypothetical protein